MEDFGRVLRVNFGPHAMLIVFSTPQKIEIREQSAAKRALEHVIQSSLSVVFTLRETATKPAEFRGRNTTILLYCIKFELILYCCCGIMSY